MSTTDRIELRLPQLAEGVTSVTVGVWLKREGATVEAGEPIVEVETDKTTVELEAPASGVLSAIEAREGSGGLEAGALLAVITPAGGAGASRAARGPVEVGSSAATATAPQPIPSPPLPAPGPVAAPPDDHARTPATPLARKMAAAAGLDLAAIAGTGRDGRVSKADVDRAMSGGRGSAAPARAPVIPMPETPTAAAGAPHHDEPLTAIRRVTATRMQQAKQTVPHFYLQVDCVVDAAMGLVERAKTASADPRPTVTDVVVRATALALREVPRANSAWVDGALRVYETVDIALAVNTPAGLITPVLRQVDRKDLRVIAGETRTLVARAREGTLAPADYTGGTFTISNLGMYGVDGLYAIVNPPQSGILGVGAAARRPVAAGDAVRVAWVMRCSLSADHRAIDGALGAELLAAVKRYLEQPALMVL